MWHLEEKRAFVFLMLWFVYRRGGTICWAVRPQCKLSKRRPAAQHRRQKASRCSSQADRQGETCETHRTTHEKLSETHSATAEAASFFYLLLLFIYLFVQQE